MHTFVMLSETFRATDLNKNISAVTCGMTNIIFLMRRAFFWTWVMPKNNCDAF